MKQAKIMYHIVVFVLLLTMAGVLSYQDQSIRALLDNQYAVAAIQDVQSQMIVRNMRDLDTMNVQIDRLNRMLSISSLD